MDANAGYTASILAAIALQTFWISRSIGRVESKQDAMSTDIKELSASMHADFIEHLRREHKIGLD